MGLSTPVAAVLIVLVTVVPMLLIAGFTARFISRNFRDAAGAIEPKPARRWFGLRRVKSNDSATTSLATNTLHYDDSWPDLESLRTYQDTPTPSIQRGIHEVSGQLCQPLNGLLCDDISIENESALLSGVNKQSSTGM
ncbi:hypothetical protein HER10_EVM0013438 [Colletotrichum scovillei]|uniref:uncharacterized protein n=1 Tax=Colletotrichum scovillei TaxID=1209932 RepID=UPI0015C36A87|nr:uncharacterized protein HER10_EVM0013438 [Colletotrichum scovillei]KAF4774472.1 hypothetical protein HER10_EVM0013438 [Colletotrichum scovillei]